MGQRRWNKIQTRREKQIFSESYAAENARLKEFGKYLDELSKNFREATPAEKTEIRRRLEEAFCQSPVSALERQI